MKTHHGQHKGNQTDSKKEICVKKTIISVCISKKVCIFCGKSQNLGGTLRQKGPHWTVSMTRDKEKCLERTKCPVFLAQGNIQKAMFTFLNFCFAEMGLVHLTKYAS